MAATDHLGYLLEVVGDLGDEDGIGPGRDPGVGGDPALGSAHDLDQHDPVVGFGGGGDPVDRLGGDLQSCVEPEGPVGGGDVVVDGLGDADDLEPLPGQLKRGAERPVPADHDERFDVVRFDGSPHTLVAVPVDVRVLPRGSENGAAAGEDPAHRIPVEGTGPSVHETLPAVEDPHHLGVVTLGGSGHHRPDDGVESRAIPPGGQDPDDVAHVALAAQYRNIGLPVTCRIFGR